MSHFYLLNIIWSICNNYFKKGGNKIIFKSLSLFKNHFFHGKKKNPECGIFPRKLHL